MLLKKEVHETGKTSMDFSQLADNVYSLELEIDHALHDAGLEDTTKTQHLVDTQRRIEELQEQLQQ